MSEKSGLGGLDLDKLIAMRTLLEKQSVSAAARKLNLAQPTLSQLLAQLRTTFGDPLLVRSGNRMLRTAGAEALCGRLNTAINSLEALGKNEEFSPKSTVASFRIACTDFVAGLLFPPVVRQLRSAAPNMSIVLQNWGDRRLEQLADSGLELGIGTGERDVAGIYRRPLFTERFVCVADRKNRKACGSLTTEKFAELPHMRLSVKGAGGGAVDVALERLGLTRHIALSVPHFWLAGDFITGTDMVLTIPRRLAELLKPRYPQLKCVPLPFELPAFSVSLFWHERVHLDPPHRYLRGVIADSVRSGRKAS